MIPEVVCRGAQRGGRRRRRRAAAEEQSVRRRRRRRRRRSRRRSQRSHSNSQTHTAHFLVSTYKADARVVGGYTLGLEYSLVQSIEYRLMNPLYQLPETLTIAEVSIF